MRVPRRTKITLPGLGAALTSPSALVMLWAAAFVIVFGICVLLPQNVKQWDFSIYYMSATLLHDGRNPYTTGFEPMAERMGLEAGAISHATDPPTFLLCMEPFALVTERTGFYIWIALNAIFLAGALMMLLGRASGLEARKGLALAAIALLYPPVGWHFLAAQSKIPVLLLLVAMMRSMERGWDRLAGLCLAFAGLTRVFPLLLLVYLLIQRRWRVLNWTFIGLVAGGLSTIGLIGIGESLSFLVHGQRDLVHHWLGYPANIALAAVVSRLFWFVTGEASATFDWLRQIAIATADVALLATTIWATLRLKPGEDPDWRVFSMWVVSSVLLSPTAWTYYMVLFFIPFAQLAVAANRGRASRRAQIAAILSYLILFGLPEVTYPHTDGVRTDQYTWVMSQASFVSAMLAYLAAFWFTIDKAPALDKATDRGQDLVGLPRTAAEMN